MKLDIYPFEIEKILTDNGLEFTNEFIKSKKTKQTTKKISKFSQECKKNNIEHRKTKPFHPWTNGMMERLNGTIKENTIYNQKYTSISHLEENLENFKNYYNLYRSHSSLKKEMKVSTPIEAVLRLSNIAPEIFLEKVLQLGKKVYTFAKPTENKLQPRET